TLALGDAVDAGDRARRFRYAGAARRLRGTNCGGYRRDRRRFRAQALSARIRGAVAALIRRRSPAAAAAGARPHGEQRVANGQTRKAFRAPPGLARRSPAFAW